MLDTLVCQAYYNRHIITILNHLVSGNNANLYRDWDKEFFNMTHQRIRDSHLYQIPVLNKFVGKCYHDLFKWLIEEKKTIPLGLRRSVDSNSVSSFVNIFSYIWCNIHN